MRTRKPVTVSALDRVLDGLVQELLAASDEDILAAAHDLGMDPGMRGSAAFFGLKYGDPGELFAEFDEARRALANHGGTVAISTVPKRRDDSTNQ